MVQVEQRGVRFAQENILLAAVWQMAAGLRKVCGPETKEERVSQTNFSKTDKTARKILEMISAKNIPHSYAE